MVVLAVLEVVAAHYFDLAEVGILLPLHKACSGFLTRTINEEQLTLRKSTFLSSFCSWNLNCRTIFSILYSV